MAHNVHVVILAGGSGSRFWPLSRELSPKQMLEVFGKRSLLVQTIERASQVMTAESTLNIVVGETLLDEIRNHLKAHHEFDAMTINYIVEPCARNTAPALALAAATIKLHDPTGIVMMLPSDHLCESGDRWLRRPELLLHGHTLMSLSQSVSYPRVLRQAMVTSRWASKLLHQATTDLRYTRWTSSLKSLGATMQSDL